jgi:hypothetical protein
MIFYFLQLHFVFFPHFQRKQSDHVTDLLLQKIEHLAVMLAVLNMRIFVNGNPDKQRESACYETNQKIKST